MARIAVFSDSHGNAYALEKVLEEIRSETFDQIVCLGDAIQGGPQPAECVALLRDLGCHIVMGNADYFLLNGPEPDDKTPPDKLKKQLEVREWQLTKLPEEDLAFIRRFMPTVELRLDGARTLLCFHAVPKNFDDVILPSTPDTEVQKHLAHYLPRIMCGGHTHTQFVRRIGASDAFFFNPGSVGFAYSHEQPDDATFHYDAFAEYAVITAENERISLEFRRVPYELGDLVTIYQESGRPYADELIAMYRR